MPAEGRALCPLKREGEVIAVRLRTPSKIRDLQRGLYLKFRFYARMGGEETVVGQMPTDWETREISFVAGDSRKCGGARYYRGKPKSGSRVSPQERASSRSYSGSAQHGELDADLQQYFDTIAHDKLMKLIAGRISDRHILRWIKQWRPVVVLPKGGWRTAEEKAPYFHCVSLMRRLWEGEVIAAQ